ncbi:hypothetical protein Hanom_Chr11g01023141 [Helianthus anomalus]
MFVHLTKRAKILVRVHLFNKQTNTNELPTKWFTNRSPNVLFVCSPSRDSSIYKKMKSRHSKLNQVVRLTKTEPSINELEFSLELI